MNIKQLQYFVLSAEEKSITTAAKKLHMAQPPLSRQITLLEEELQVSLIYRHNKGIELTESGRVFLIEAKKILAELEALEQKIKETNHSVNGVVNIGTVYSNMPVINEKIKFMNANYPHVFFKILQDDPHALLDLLEKGTVDVLFMRAPTCKTGQFRYQLLEEDQFVVVANRKIDPYPHKTDLTIPQLKDIPFCMLRSGNYWAYNEFLITECERYGFKPNIICECSDTSIVMQMVIQGLGFSYQPKMIVDSFKSEDVYIKNIPGFSVKTSPILVWNENKYLSRAIKIFISLFNDAYSESLVDPAAPHA